MSSAIAMSFCEPGGDTRAALAERVRKRRQSLGVLWLARVVFPDACDYDLVGQAGDFYRLFYGLDRTAEELIGLVGGYDGRGYAAE